MLKPMTWFWEPNPIKETLVSHMTSTMTLEERTHACESESQLALRGSRQPWRAVGGQKTLTLGCALATCAQLARPHP